MHLKSSGFLYQALCFLYVICWKSIYESFIILQVDKSWDIIFVVGCMLPYHTAAYPQQHITVKNITLFIEFL